MAGALQCESVSLCAVMSRVTDLQRVVEQARRQQQSRSLQIEDGWSYFLHGWTQVIAEVFDVPIASSGPQFDALSEIARRATTAG